MTQAEIPHHNINKSKIIRDENDRNTLFNRTFKRKINNNVTYLEEYYVNCNLLRKLQNIYYNKFKSLSLSLFELTTYIII